MRTQQHAHEQKPRDFCAKKLTEKHRLHSETLNDLVYTRVNLRLQQARNDPGFKEVVSEWIDSAAVESEVELDGAADASADDGAVEVVYGDVIELA